MIFSYHWLKELSGTKRSPEQLAELLMMHAFEVETVEPYKHGLDGLVIGKVLTVAKHPDADRLRVTTVEVGRGNVRTIVCGASNVAPLQKVAVVLPGQKLPNGTVIKEAALRGVVSQGMICSETELGLGDDHAGIMVFPPSAPLGKSLASYLNLDDFQLDVKILPDRSSDALSYLGLAMEIAALEGVTAPVLTPKKVHRRRKPSPQVPRVSLKTPLCDRYAIALYRKVSEATSPLWLKTRLLVSGLRPVSGLVDVTNYLMLLTGQPMHAFDADAIGKGGLVIRQGKGRERLTLLDGRVIQPSKNDILIADNKKALALAGIMGGKSSAITDKTKNVAIEIAHFNQGAIRLSRKQHRLMTDASFRFERGFDVSRVGEALIELERLMTDLGWGEYAGSRDVGVHSEVKPKPIKLSLDLVERVLGVSVPLIEVVQRLALLGLSVKKVSQKKELSVLVPSRRMDLRDEWDLIEEIGRMRGYDLVKSEAPQVALLPTPVTEEKRLERSLGQVLRGLGYDELMLYSFYGEKTTELFGLDKLDHLRVANPMSPDQALMRTSLLPNLLSATARNLRHFKEVRSFEVGHVFSHAKPRPKEALQLAMVSVDVTLDPEEAFFVFKSHLEAFFANFGLKPVTEALAQTPGIFHPTRSAVLSVAGETLGHFGEVHPVIARKLGIRARPIACEIDLGALEKALPGVPTITPLRRFPLAHRDISLIGKKDISFAEISALLKESGGPLLVHAELFDVYREGEEKSYAFHLAFGHPDRTIRSQEMDEAFDGIVKKAADKFGMRLKLS